MLLKIYTMPLQTHRFIKEDSGWYIDLPAYLQQGGSKGDLQMIDGADTMLDIAAAGNLSVTLQMDTTPFDDADKLELTEVCDPLVAGAYYLLRNWEGSPVMHSM